MPFPEILFCAIGVVFLSVGALVWWLEPTRRARRALSSTTQKRLGAIGEGERARVLGVARRGPERLTSPLTQRDCIGYRLVVEELTEAREGGRAWCHRVTLEDCAAFELHADGAVASVEGPFLFGLEIDARGGGDTDLEPAVLDALERLGERRVDGFDRPRKLRFTEAILEEGDPIFVLGRASLMVDQRGQRESSRGQPIMRVIRGTKRQPTVLADEFQPGILLA